MRKLKVLIIGFPWKWNKVRTSLTILYQNAFQETQWEKSKLGDSLKEQDNTCFHIKPWIYSWMKTILQEDMTINQLHTSILRKWMSFWNAVGQHLNLITNLSCLQYLISTDLYPKGICIMLVSSHTQNKDLRIWNSSNTTQLPLALTY